MFKKPYEKRKRYTYKSNKPSMTQQHFKNECDINNIMKKYEKTGVIEHVRKNAGFYADVSQYGDYRTNCEKVILAEEMFETLPAKLRRLFNNDPGEFLDFASDPANAPKMAELGLTTNDPVISNTKTKPEAQNATQAKQTTNSAKGTDWPSKQMTLEDRLAHLEQQQRKPNNIND